MMAVLALSACSGGNDTSAGGDAPTSTTSSTSVEPSGPPSEEPSTPTPTPTPTPAFPTAKDGQNYKACADGNCEVLIRKAAQLTLSGRKVNATVADGRITITNAKKDGGSNFTVSVQGTAGVATWGSMGGPMHSASLKAAEGTTAILILRTRS
jgi:hypothetical protein